MTHETKDLSDWTKDELLDEAGDLFQAGAEINEQLKHEPDDSPLYAELERIEHRRKRLEQELEKRG